MLHFVMYDLLLIVLTVQMQLVTISTYHAYQHIPWVPDRQQVVYVKQFPVRF